MESFVKFSIDEVEIEDPQKVNEATDSMVVVTVDSFYGKKKGKTNFSLEKMV